jgi:hypothetical protein
LRFIDVQDVADVGITRFSKSGQLITILVTEFILAGKIKVLKLCAPPGLKRLPIALPKPVGIVRLSNELQPFIMFPAVIVPVPEQEVGNNIDVKL